MGLVSKYTRPHWLTESQIGDLLWRDWESHFEDLDFQNAEKFREYQIGSIRPDFLTFSKSEKSAPLIGVFELKITADFDSIKQLCRYKRHIDEYIRLSFCKYGFASIPDVNLNLIAKSFDAHIVDLAHELKIELWRVELDDNKNICVELEYYDYFPNVPEDDAFLSKVNSFFGVTNG